MQEACETREITKTPQEEGQARNTTDVYLGLIRVCHHCQENPGEQAR